MAIVTYYAWPKVDVQLATAPFIFNELWHREMANRLKSEQPAAKDDLTITWLRQRVEFLAHSENSPMRESFRKYDTPFTNWFTGGPIIEEDSPGNFQIMVKGDTYQYVWYDGHGRAKSEPLFTR